jgi:hypothetical protein
LKSHQGLAKARAEGLPGERGGEIGRQGDIVDGTQSPAELDAVQVRERLLKTVLSFDEWVEQDGVLIQPRPGMAGLRGKRRHDLGNAVLVEEEWHGDAGLVECTLAQLEEAGLQAGPVQAVGGGIDIRTEGQEGGLREVEAISLANGREDPFFGDAGLLVHFLARE